MAESEQRERRMASWAAARRRRSCAGKALKPPHVDVNERRPHVAVPLPLPFDNLPAPAKERDGRLQRARTKQPALQHVHQQRRVDGGNSASMTKRARPVGDARPPPPPSLPSCPPSGVQPPARPSASAAKSRRA